MSSGDWTFSLSAYPLATTVLPSVSVIGCPTLPLWASFLFNGMTSGFMYAWQTVMSEGNCEYYPSLVLKVNDIPLSVWLLCLPHSIWSRTLYLHLRLSFGNGAINLAMNSRFETRGSYWHVGLPDHQASTVLLFKAPRVSHAEHAWFFPGFCLLACFLGVREGWDRLPV